MFRPAFMLVAAALIAAMPAVAAEKPPPLMRDFIGLNVHTVQFKPQLYAPVTRLVRDYHPVDWDIGKDVSRAATFPRAQNGVDWKQLYGSWRRDGFRINACLIFEGIEPVAWKDGDAAQYGRDFARAFGVADEVVIAAVFRSSLPESERLSAEQLVEDLRARQQRARYIAPVDDIIATIVKERRDGDIVVLMSNGGFGGIHRKLLKALA